MTITSVVTALGKWNPGLEGLDWVVALGVDSDMISLSRVYLVG